MMRYDRTLVPSTRRDLLRLLGAAPIVAVTPIGGNLLVPRDPQLPSEFWDGRTAIHRVEEARWAVAFALHMHTRAWGRLIEDARALAAGAPRVNILGEKEDGTRFMFRWDKANPKQVSIMGSDYARGSGAVVQSDHFVRSYFQWQERCSALDRTNKECKDRLLSILRLILPAPSVPYQVVVANIAGRYYHVQYQHYEIDLDPTVHQNLWVWVLLPQPGDLEIEL